MALAAAPDISGFRALSPLGYGPTSTIYSAQGLTLGRWVALTVYSTTLPTERAQRRFTRSFDVARRLGAHPHIVTMLESGLTFEQQPYVATEIYERGTLQGRLDGGLPLSVDEALHLGVQLAGALETAHRADVVHGGIQPSRVLLSDDGEPALADFGLVPLVDRGGLATLVGPIAFHAAPEVLEARPVSPATDVYALASTLHAALTGRAPYDRGDDDDTTAALLVRILQHDVPPIGRSDVPASLETMLRQALRSEPHDRPARVLAFARELQNCQKELGLPVTQPVVLDVAGSIRLAAASPEPRLAVAPVVEPAPPTPVQRVFVPAPEELDLEPEPPAPAVEPPDLGRTAAPPPPAHAAVASPPPGPTVAPPLPDPTAVPFAPDATVAPPLPDPTAVPFAPDATVAPPLPDPTAVPFAPDTTVAAAPPDPGTAPELPDLAVPRRFAPVAGEAPVLPQHLPLPDFPASLPAPLAAASTSLAPPIPTLSRPAPVEPPHDALAPAATPPPSDSPPWPDSKSIDAGTRVPPASPDEASPDTSISADGWPWTDDDAPTDATATAAPTWPNPTPPDTTHDGWPWTTDTPTSATDTTTAAPPWPNQTPPDTTHDGWPWTTDAPTSATTATDAPTGTANTATAAPTWRDQVPAAADGSPFAGVQSRDLRPRPGDDPPAAPSLAAARTELPADAAPSAEPDSHHASLPPVGTARALPVIVLVALVGVLGAGLAWAVTSHDPAERDQAAMAQGAETSDDPPTSDEVTHVDVTAVENPTGVQLDWDGGAQGEQVVVVLSETEDPRIIEAETGTALLVPHSSLREGTGYCFAVASTPDPQPAPALLAELPDDAVAPTACIRGAAPTSVRRD